MSPDKQTADTLRRYKKVAHVNRYSARLYATASTPEKAEEILDTLRLSHSGLITEVLT